MLDALEQALYAHQPARNGPLVHCSDYFSTPKPKRLAEAGLDPSMGSDGNSYDNAQAEMITPCAQPRL